MAPGMSVARRPLPVSPVSFKPQPKNESARSSTPYRIYSKRKITNLPLKPTLHQAKPFGKPLIGYINSYAVFSGRKNFTDCFDSNIDIPHPTPEHILELLQDPIVGSNATTVTTWLSSGALTPDGRRALSEWEAILNNLFDSYPIYSLSIHNDCHLLWAHYAACHTGFCIDFEF